MSLGGQPSFSVCLVSAAKYSVFAVGEADDCQVVDVLAQMIETNSNHSAKGMLRLIISVVPEKGMELASEKIHHLDESIWEYRVFRKSGPKLRVLFFRDGNRFICTRAFEKERTVPRKYITEAKELRSNYLAARASSKLKIDDVRE